MVIACLRYCKFFSITLAFIYRELEGSPLVWHPAIDPNFQVLPSVGKFSKEEQLQWERKRLVTSGITSYEIHHESGRLIFPAGGSMFQCVDPGNHVVNLQPVQLETNCGGARLNCQICPNLSELVAFVSNSDVWVAHTESGKKPLAVLFLPSEK